MEIDDKELNVKYKHFNIICRICLKTNYRLTSIFAEEPVSEMMELCTGLKVLLEDKLPQNICTDCLNELKGCYQFRGKCIKAQDILENVFYCHEMQLNYEGGGEDPLSYSNEYDEMDKEMNNSSHSESRKKYRIRKEPNIIEEKFVKSIKRKKLKNKALMIEINQKSSKKRIKQINPKQCQICGKLYNCLRGHLKKMHSNRFKCEFCNKTRPTLEGLHKHMNTHQTEYTCEYCNKTYVDKRRMLEHQAVQHIKDKKYQCDKCNKEFFILRSLKKHQIIHDKNYIQELLTCNICQKQITSKDNLRKHMLIHTGEKRYKCEFCSKAFVRSENLKDHRRVHTKERPFICSHCGSTFTQKSSLNLHLKKFHIVSSVKETD